MSVASRNQDKTNDKISNDEIRDNEVKDNTRDPIKGINWSRIDNSDQVSAPIGGGVGRQQNFMIYEPEPTKKELRAQIKSLEENLQRANEIIEYLRNQQDDIQIRLRRGMDQTLDEERYFNMVQLDKIKYELRRVRDMIDNFARYSYAVVKRNDILDKRPCLFNIKRKMDEIYKVLYTMEGKSPSEWIPPSIHYHVQNKDSNNRRRKPIVESIYYPIATHPQPQNEYTILGTGSSKVDNTPDTKSIQRLSPGDKIFNHADNGLDKSIKINRVDKSGVKDSEKREEDGDNDGHKKQTNPKHHSSHHEHKRDDVE